MNDLVTQEPISFFLNSSVLFSIETFVLRKFMSEIRSQMIALDDQ